MSRIPKTAQVGASSPLIAAILRQMRFLKTTGMRGAELRSWNGHDLDFGLNVKHSPRNAIERITLGRGLAAESSLSRQTGPTRSTISSEHYGFLNLSDHSRYCSLTIATYCQKPGVNHTKLVLGQGFALDSSRTANA